MDTAPPPSPPGFWSLGRFRVARWLFPRLLALVYACAFASWAVQWEGLLGAEGILPVPQLVENIHAYEAREQTSLWLEYPTVLRWRSDDAFALLLCWGCCGLALLVMAGLWQGPLLLVLWAAYLSLAAVGEIFMGYQWDALLLEAGLLGVFLAPWRLRPGRLLRAPGEPPWMAVLLLHWLVFRLMFLSGFVKLAGGDRTWWECTALLYHYETQPLPNALSWFAHHLPRWLHAASCAVMHGIEVGLPFAIFLGRWGRRAAAGGFVLLMALIFATGNYNFFNLLTAALALCLVDDAGWPRRVRAWLRLDEAAPPVPARWHWRQWPALAFAPVCLVLTLAAADAFLAGRVPWYARVLPGWAHQFSGGAQSLRSFNAYGLFQAMTTERPEIIVEVSDDGALWLPLEFKWKPGRQDRAPGFAAPHQPRLDWQMWFAALSPRFDPRRDGQPGSPLYWYGRFVTCLLEKKPAVWALVEPPPLPVEDIRHVRAKLYRYRFSSPAHRRETGEWWVREYAGMWAPAFSIRKEP